MRRYFWLVPIMMLALAALACDSPSYDPPHVSRVEADPTTPGKAYILVEGDQSLMTQQVQQYQDKNGTQSTPRAYETTDYGQHWQPSSHTFPKPKSSTRDATIIMPDGIALSLAGETLYADQQPVWSFPRPTFRSFFGPSDPHETPYFHLPSYSYSFGLIVDVSAADPTVIWIGMGTEGVLVGPTPHFPSKANPRPWTLTQNGIDAIHPLRLTITDPVVIWGIILWAMLVPPLAGLHTWLIAQAYRYAFSEGERRGAYRLAAAVSGGIALLAIGAIVIWLTDIQTDYYPIVGMMTLLTVMISVGAAVWLGRSRHFSDGFVRRLALAAGLLALIVPIGVAAVWFAWPFIITLTVAVALFRHCLEGHLEGYKAKTTLWQLDRLSMEITAIFALMLAPLGAVVSGAIGIFSPLLSPIGLIIAIILSLAVLRTYINWRGNTIIIKKKVGSLETDTPIFRNMAWSSKLLGYAIVIVVVSTVLAGAVFFGQSAAYNWFQTLLLPK